MSVHLLRVDTIKLYVNQNARKPTHQLCELDLRLRSKRDPVQMLLIINNCTLLRHALKGLP